MEPWINPKFGPERQAYARSAHDLDELRKSVLKYEKDRKLEREVAIAAAAIIDMVRLERLTSQLPKEEDYLEPGLRSFIDRHRDPVLECLIGYNDQMRNRAFKLRVEDGIENKTIAFNRILTPDQPVEDDLEVHSDAMALIANTTQMSVILHVTRTGDPADLALFTFTPVQ